MQKQTVNCLHSRARAEIYTHGGRVCGWHRRLPVVYAVPPLSGPVWPVVKMVEVIRGVRKVTRTSNIDGCTVIWR
ncbi:hypothetical protein [Candidatus Erwinia dacicola]|uniref:Uncharacterized protein n=1 Tax=Candidatus Erwinia dacicola TaxID=252393 RepID=A0A328TI34_9GAMM|nr:hypothetical protein [Candidatus Erwinia dacicola]RAP70277.1 hypothetical protein ACZ87_02921 [Candidatus Erwinia dacicola]